MLSGRATNSWLLLYDGGCVRGLTTTNVRSDSCLVVDGGYRKTSSGKEESGMQKGMGMGDISLVWDEV
jgi:hypothetical protein